jgi:pimeloyl-ACP methyl ester carboxylesterase
VRIAAFGTVLALAASACTPVVGGASATQTQSDRSVRLRGVDVKVHLIAGSAHATGPLLIYTTGDGGWPGDPALFDLMAAWGYPMAGVSAPDWIETITAASSGVLDPSALATDYLSVIDEAMSALNLPKTTAVVVVGFSRGSGFVVAAAMDARLRARVRGVLAVALTAEEEYVAERGPASDAATMFKTYEALPRIGSLPVAVIQSTRDDFLPAAQAQQRFGPETSTRRFRAVDAADHSFGGKQSELIAEMRASLDWILQGPRNP